MFSISPIIVLRKIIHINSTIYVQMGPLFRIERPLLLGGGVGEAEKVGSFAKIAGAEEPRREARCGGGGVCATFPQCSNYLEFAALLAQGELWMT